MWRKSERNRSKRWIRPKSARCTAIFSLSAAKQCFPSLPQGARPRSWASSGGENNNPRNQRQFRQATNSGALPFGKPPILSDTKLKRAIGPGRATKGSNRTDETLCRRAGSRWLRQTTRVTSPLTGNPPAGPAAPGWHHGLARKINGFCRAGAVTGSPRQPYKRKCRDSAIKAIVVRSAALLVSRVAAGIRRQ